MKVLAACQTDSRRTPAHQWEILGSDQLHPSWWDAAPDLNLNLSGVDVSWSFTQSICFQPWESVTCVCFPWLRHSAGPGVCHVDEEEGQGETGKAAPHRPRRRRPRQHSEIWRGGRRRGGPGTGTHTELSRQWLMRSPGTKRCPMLKLSFDAD